MDQKIRQIEVLTNRLILSLIKKFFLHNVFMPLKDIAEVFRHIRDADLDEPLDPQQDQHRQSISKVHIIPGQAPLRHGRYGEADNPNIGKNSCSAIKGKNALPDPDGLPADRVGPSDQMHQFELVNLDFYQNRYISKKRRQRKSHCEQGGIAQHDHKLHIILQAPFRVHPVVRLQKELLVQV